MERLLVINKWDVTGWTVTTAVIKYNGVTTTTYNISINIIHRWDSNIKIKLLLILLYNIITALSLLLCCHCCCCSIYLFIITSTPPFLSVFDLYIICFLFLVVDVVNFIETVVLLQN